MNNNKLALIIAYYLARFDRKGLDRLGFNSFNEAFEETASILSVKKNYVKLRRDEFDPAFPWRRGWQRPMDRQIVRTLEAFQNLDENAIYRIVYDILNKEEYRKSDEIKEIEKLLTEDKMKSFKKGEFILRAPTGRQAEEAFVRYFNTNKDPCPGILVDTRDLGCGYDFRIERTEGSDIYIEVKGLSDITGGVVFTDKEWYTAVANGDLYFLALVTDVKNDPKIKLFKNPSRIFNPKKRVYTTVQIQWGIGVSEINNAK